MIEKAITIINQMRKGNRKLDSYRNTYVLSLFV